MAEFNLVSNLRHDSKPTNEKRKEISCNEVLEMLTQRYGSNVKFLGLVGNELLVSIKFDEY